VAGGWSAIFLGTFYWVIDVRGWKGWCAPFVWVGTNSITVYLAGSIIDFERLASRFTGGQVKDFLDQSVAPGTGTLVLALTGLGLVLVLARFLYRRQIFIRV
jgi:predicted acyltransferase